MAATFRNSRSAPASAAPRFGGVLWRAARVTSPLMVGLAGRRWNPIFSIVEHVGRRSGRRYTAPVAARRADDGFIVALAFGTQVDWHVNLIAGGGGTVRWRGRAYVVGAPTRINRDAALAAFHPIQRLFLRIAGIDGYIRLDDIVEPS